MTDIVEISRVTWTPGKRRLSQLIPWRRNPRQIQGRQVERLQESLVEFGQVETIAIGPNDEVYNGHQRLKAWAAKYGDVEVDVRIASRPLTEREREKLTVYLHKGAAGEWDFDMLANEWDADLLVEWGFDEGELGLIGDAEDAGRDTEPETDRAEELRQKWSVEPGQLWQLGEHRLICGDCTDAATVARVMGGEKAAICFTSPPYNAGVSAQLSGNTSIKDNLYRDEYDDNKTQDEWLSLVSSATATAISVSEYVFVNVQMLAGNKRAFTKYLDAFCDNLADIAIWDKQHAAPQQAQRVMDSRFEFIVVFSHSGTRAIGTREFRGMVHNVYTGSPQRTNEFADIHAATFPVDFPEHFIKTFTNKSEFVFEPFSGSGTTIIACENLGRRCRAVEISPAYVAVALERWATHTGKTPVLIEP